ncbi:hypothetical protein [Larkinella soli]|uniref:hypothetical protein n=1 Tax=Larkinella soli TaxID=1770527 RepID=UPI000FFB2EA7|nr:hypothetical protein [Larkinella soli]
MSKKTKIQLELDPLEMHQLLALLNETRPRKQALRGLATPLRDNLLNQLNAENVAVSVDEAVRGEIARLAGLPADQVFNDDKLSTLGFSTSLIKQRLAAALTGVAQNFKPGAQVTFAEVDGCDTVEDCIDLVKNKI